MMQNDTSSGLTLLGLLAVVFLMVIYVFIFPYYDGRTLLGLLAVVFLMVIYGCIYPYYKDTYLWVFFGLGFLVAICFYIYEFYRRLDLFAQSVGILLLLGIGFYFYQFYKFSGEFHFERTYLESIQNGNEHHDNYKGAILNGDFRSMDIVKVGMESTICNITKYRDCHCNKLFQLTFIHKDNPGEDTGFIADEIRVSVKYCKKNGICLTVEKEDYVLVRRIKNITSNKTYFRGVLSLRFKKEGLFIYYKSSKPICSLLANLSAENLENYELNAGLGILDYGRSVMTFYGGMVVSNQVQKELYVASDGQAIANFDIDTDYKGSFANFAIHKTTSFGRSILEYNLKVYFKPYSKYMYTDRKEKNLIEFGLAPMNLISKKTLLRNLKETVFMQLSFEYGHSDKSIFHLHTWINGNVSIHKVSTADKEHLNNFIEFHFQFNINVLSKHIRLSVKEKGKLNYVDEFHNVDFEAILYPSVGKETSLFPIEVSYIIWKS